MIDIMLVRRRFEAMKPHLDERQRRLFAAAEVIEAGAGSFGAVCRGTGLSAKTVRRGIRELAAAESLPSGRVRRPGGGCKRCVDKDAGLLAELRDILEASTRGDPQAPLLWTSRSVAHIRQALARRGHEISASTVRRLLHGLGYSLQANRKTREGENHPDRDAQFGVVGAAVKQALAAGEPAISVDTKKKELVGDFKNGGREWRPKGDPEPVRVHDFVDPAQGKVAPYGVYDIGANTGWVSVGISHDTACFAVNAIRTWWREMGGQRYPQASRLVVTADCGGSNGPRLRLWKMELQKLADETGLTIAIHHLPPGTSKWNRIEHKLFAFISINWRSKPLVSRQAIVQLIGSTTTETGLTVRAVLDETDYPKGIKVSDHEFATVNLTPADFHGEWNYTIKPNIHAECLTNSKDILFWRAP